MAHKADAEENQVAYLDGSFQLEEDGLGDEYFAGLGAEVANLCLEQLDLLARSAAPHLQEAINYRVEIDFVLVRHCRGSSPAKKMAHTDDGVSVMTDRSQQSERATERGAHVGSGVGDTLLGD